MITPQQKPPGFHSIDPDEQKEFDKLSIVNSFFASPSTEPEEKPFVFNLSNVGIQLPAIVHFKSHELVKLPDRDCTLWGILMKYDIEKKEKKARHTGVIFMPNDQRKRQENKQERLPIMTGYSAMWEWALNSDNVPFMLRFDTLGGPLKKICGPSGPHPVHGSHKRGYLQPTKCWVLPEVGMTIEQIYNKGWPIYNYWEELRAKDMPIVINKGTTRQRKRKLVLE
jgi:hypothetical protein